MIQVTVEDDERAFRGHVLAYTSPRSYSGNKTRPYFAVVAASSGEHRPFITNVRAGKVLGSFGRAKFEFLKTAGYAYATQQIGTSYVTTIYLPHLFTLDPGVVESDHVEFVCLPSLDHLAERDPIAEVTSVVSQEFVMSISELFCAMLDKRVPYPIPQSEVVRFHLFRQFLKLGLANIVQSYGLESVGYYRHAFRCYTSMESVAEAIKGTIKAVTDHYGSEILWQD